MFDGLNILMIAGAALPAMSGASAPPDASPTWSGEEAVAFLNGQWFDGEGYVQRPVYLVQGRLSHEAPPRIDRHVDLAGGYVVPPLGDAHTHVFDGPWGFEAQRRSYLADGVFYAMSLTAPATGVAQIRDRLSGPGQVDVVSAIAGFTGPESHPAEIYEANALGYFSYPQQLAHMDEIRASRRVADIAYFVVRTAQDVEAKWPILERQDPDIVKVFLRHSERYAEGYGKWGPGGGIDPALLPGIVERAHRSGRRVAVAASSVDDLEAIVAARADVVSHMPCGQDTSEAGPYQHLPEEQECVIPGDLARAMRDGGVSLVLAASNWEVDRPAHIIAWEQANIATLRSAGVEVAIASESYGRTPVPGLVAAADKGLLSNRDLLRLSTMDTPRAIFPTRRVGCLDAGCEASFLVLDQDPLTDMKALRSIRLRVKDGMPLYLPPAPTQGARGD